MITAPRGILGVVGANPLDANGRAEQVIFDEQGLWATLGNKSYRVDCSPPPVWGGKCKRTGPLPDILTNERVIVRPGGGGPNSARRFGELVGRDQRGRHPLRVMALHPYALHNSLAADYAALSIQAMCLTDVVSPLNLVVAAQGVADRVVIKSPLPADLQILPERAAAARAFLAGAEMIALNSPALPELAEWTLAAGRPFCAVLNDALSITLRWRCWRQGFAVVANLAEFAPLAGDLGISCPTDETTATHDAVAEALARVAASRVPAGVVAVTMGARGAIVREANGAIISTALADHWFERAQEAVQADRRVGSGDRWFASWALGVSCARRGNRYSATRAAVQASLEVLTDLTGGALSPEPSWFVSRFLRGSVSPTHRRLSAATWQRR
jgi:sugar/nucleoside kinase (ribokinase family)